MWVWDAVFEQWHRLLFARFRSENEPLRRPEFDAPVLLAECGELADELGGLDVWSVGLGSLPRVCRGIIRLDGPCVQLQLVPEHRMALERTIAGLPDEAFAANDSLEWTYQYRLSERNDHVNWSDVMIGGVDLGPVTQLLTENRTV